jgi:uridine kinase
MYDHQAIRTELLEPLGPGGSRRFRTATFDQQRQLAVPVTWIVAPDDAILLVDGSLMYRPELNDLWDFRVFVDIDFDLVLQRGSQRDQAWMDSLAAAEHRYRTRYIPGEKMYVEDVRPHEQADVILDNRDFSRPRLQPGGPRSDL